MFGTPSSHAPSLTDEKIARYQELASAQGGGVGEAMRDLVKLVDKWWNIPESKTPKKPHHSGATLQELDQPSKNWLKEYLPWRDVLDMYASRFDALPDGEVRNAAYHLLWFAVELSLGREPMTI